LDRSNRSEVLIFAGWKNSDRIAPKIAQDKCLRLLFARRAFSSSQTIGSRLDFALVEPQAALREHDAGILLLILRAETGSIQQRHDNYFPVDHPGSHRVAFLDRHILTVQKNIAWEKLVQVLLGEQLDLPHLLTARSRLRWQQDG